jgi:ribosome-binding protein aMBF1 (putative translation factor)
MARSKEELNRRKARAKVWLDFRKEFLFSQVQLADALGISRRMVQYAESATVTPNKEILARFDELMRKHQREKVRSQSKESFI